MVTCFDRRDRPDADELADETNGVGRTRAETLVLTPWPVGDAIARATVVSYCTGLRMGLGRGGGLPQSRLAVLATSGRTHPHYWARFIQSGKWANLEGTR